MDFQIKYAADYYPYGKILREWNPNAEKFLTTHHQRDTETGLDYRGARYYDADVARFLSLDPLAAKFAEWSAYNYVLGNPLVYVDPDGRDVQIVRPNDVNSRVGLQEAVFTVFNTNDGSFTDIEIKHPTDFIGMDQFGKLTLDGVRDKKGRFTKDFKNALKNFDSEETKSLFTDFVSAIESDTKNFVEVVTNEDSENTGTTRQVKEFEFNTSDKSQLPQNGSATFVERNGKNATLTISATQTITNSQSANQRAAQTSTSVGGNINEAMQVIRTIISANESKNPEDE